MTGFQRNSGLILVHACIASLVLFPLLVVSSQQPLESNGDAHRENQSNSEKVSPQKLLQMTVHGFLLWASMGLFMPLGIIIIRMSHRVECGKRLKFLFYCHVSLQVAAVLMATAGAILSIKNFENSFNNTHQRMGLALYALLWLQPLIGFFRPHRGLKIRSLWYFVHWFLGTGVTIVAIINIYIGLHGYQTKTSRSTRTWSILFTAEIAILSFVYLFQDRYDYMKKQGVILGNEPVAPQMSPRTTLKEFIMNC